MGVDIGDIVVKNPKKVEEFGGKIIAVDAYNTLYQFLSTIRQPDGTPLMDRKQRITSHLSGLFYRTIYLLSLGIRVVYVFDGVPPELKGATLGLRREIREKAEEDWKKAIAIGDIERARIKASQSSRLTIEMVRESMKLIEYMGMPYIQAPSEGEAQASYMVSTGKSYAVASQDFDSLLFGSTVLIRNIAVTGRRKLPRRREYINVEPEYINLNDSLESLGINREQIVDIGILVGTDFNDGIRGVGPKKALKLVKEFGTLDRVLREKNWSIPDYEEIREIYLNPNVTDNYTIKWGGLNIGEIKKYLCDERDFSEERVNSAIGKLESSIDRAQRSLDQF